MADYTTRLDTLSYGILGAYHGQSVCHVTGQVYAIAHRGTDGDGYVDTVSIDTDGSITALASLEFRDATTIEAAKIVHLAGDNYAILYSAPTIDFRIATVSITAGGAIALIDDQPVDALEMGYWEGSPDFLKVSGTTYAMVYRGDDGDGFITTLTIADNGIIGAVIQTWEFETVNLGIYPHMIHISGDIFAIACSGVNNLVTVEINGAGAITPALVGSLVIEGGGHFSIIPLAGTKYAIVYRKGADNSCQLVTVDIQNDGTIAVALTDTKEVTSYLRRPSLVRRSDGVVFITGTYRTGFHAYVRGYQVEVADDGTIGDVLRCSSGSISYSFGETSFAGVHSMYYPTPIILVNGTNNIVASFAYVQKWWIGPGVLGYIDTVGVAAEVATQATADVSDATATGHGNVTKLGEPNPSQHGHCWDTAPNPTVSDSKTELGAVAATGPFTSNLTGLNHTTTYYVRAYVISGVNAVYGAEVSFTTLIGSATVTTEPETGVGQLITTFNGTLNDDGGEACECGFEWGTDIGYGVRTPTESKTIGQAFSQQILGLFPGREYHYRAFATNSAGTVYGADRSFRSKPGVGRAYALSRSEL